jgi:D-sedoheptulose 7-phosphate isomerase
VELFQELLARYPQLNVCRQDILDAYNVLREMYQSDGKLLVAGNGGSAADSEHIAGELMKSFLLARKIDGRTAGKLFALYGAEGERLANRLEGALPVIPLTGMPALSTAFQNDADPYLVFAQMVYGYGKRGDIFLGISTSGNSQNIINAVMTAKSLGLVCVGLTGGAGGRLKELCDVAIVVPETETFKIQELHLPVYHTLCAMLEADFFGAKLE